MPYLEPAHVLEQFSRFTREEVRPEIDNEFMRGQVGSMSSTLSFLAMELDGRRTALKRQRRTLLEAIATLENALDESDQQKLADALADANSRLETMSASDGSADNGRVASENELDVVDEDRLETELLSVANNLLAAIDRELDGEGARAAREPLYDFLDVRVESQLELLGRET